MQKVESNGISLREEYQLPAHWETIKHCRSSSDPAFLDQSVGAGKTIQIAFFSKHVSDKGGRVLCLARQGELIQQNSDDAWIIGCKNSVYSASLKSKSVAYPVVMGTTGTVLNALNTDFKNIKFDAIAIDEAHEVPFDDVIDCINKMKVGKDYLGPIEEKAGKPVYHSEYARIIAYFMMINPIIKIIGYSGSAIRDNLYILGRFWKKRLSHVPTDYLVSIGYLVPYVFGFSGESYSLEKFTPNKSDMADDFSSAILKKQDKEIHKQKTMTHYIMEEVIDRTMDRNGILITCAGKKHCEDVAECLPDGSYAIVTDETSFDDRMKALDDAKKGKIKYTIQVYCLGQGINVPLWDTLVILRRIGSIRYLIQLIGRILRLLKKQESDLGFIKDDGLILDYSGTMEAMGKIFDDPIINEAIAKKATQEGEAQECPECGKLNSQYAIRCIGEDPKSDDNRCEHFFSCQLCLAPIECEGIISRCNTENAPSAQSCRKCDAILIDPNKNLINKAYTEDDYKPVKRVEFSKTVSGDGLCVTYYLDSTYHDKGIEKPEIAKEYLKPFAKEQHLKAVWDKFIRRHVQGLRFRQGIARMNSVDSIIRSKAMFDIPTKITHRVNDKGFSIISKKLFKSGREEG